MKKIIFLIMSAMFLTGCSSDDTTFPYVKYQHSIWVYDKDNQIVEVPDGYILNQSYSYDIVKTKNGYDIIFHFMEDNDEY